MQLLGLFHAAACSDGSASHAIVFSCIKRSIALPKLGRIRPRSLVNAVMLESMLTGRKVAAPPDLVAAYPRQLQKFGSPEPSPT